MSLLFVIAEDINAMINDLPADMVPGEDVSCSIDPVVRWRGHQDLAQPSFASPERVFSLLQSSLKDTQKRALDDYIKASVMLQHHH